MGKREENGRVHVICGMLAGKFLVVWWGKSGGHGTKDRQQRDDFARQAAQRLPTNCHPYSALTSTLVKASRFLLPRSTFIVKTTDDATREPLVMPPRDSSETLAMVSFQNGTSLRAVLAVVGGLCNM